MTAFPHQIDAGADVNAQTRSDVDGDDAGTPLILASRFEVLSYKLYSCGILMIFLFKGVGTWILLRL